MRLTRLTTCQQMASTCVRYRLCSIFKLPKIVTCRRMKRPLYRISKRFIFTLPFFVSCEKSQSERGKNASSTFEVPDASNFTVEYLLRNACLNVIDSSVSLMSLTAVKLADLETEYVRMLEELMTLMEYRLSILDNRPQEEEISDVIINLRTDINKIKGQRQHLTMMYTTARNIVSFSAEATFMTGSETRGITANEITTKCDREVQTAQEKSSQTEMELASFTAECIAIETKLAKKDNPSESSKDKDEADKENFQSQENKDDTIQSETAKKSLNNEGSKSNDSAGSSEAKYSDLPVSTTSSHLVDEEGKESTMVKDISSEEDKEWCTPVVEKGGQPVENTSEKEIKDNSYMQKDDEKEILCEEIDKDKYA